MLRIEPDGSSFDAAAKRHEPAVCSPFQFTPCRCQSQPAKITSFLACYRVMQWLWAENMAGKIGGGEEEKEGGGDGRQDLFHGVVLCWKLKAQR